MDIRDENVLKIDLECTSCKKNEALESRVPVRRIIQKLDACFDKNDLVGARALLEYWQKEALSINDLQGELSILNELLGLYRKMNEKSSAELAISRTEELLSTLGNENSISGATILINAATTCKAFCMPERALALYEKAYIVYHENLAENDIRFAALYNNFATTLVDLERYGQAEDLYNKAISLTSKDIKALPDCAVTHINIAHMYEKKNGLEDEQIYRHMALAEDILEDTRIEKNSYFAFVAEKCAPSFDYFGYFIFAEKLRKQSREIYERA